MRLHMLNNVNRVIQILEEYNVSLLFVFVALIVARFCL